MTKTLSIAQFKAHLSEVVGEVQHTGAEVLIEKHGKPVARLVSVSPSKKGGLLSLLDIDDGQAFADALDAAMRARRKDKGRKVPGLT